MTCNVCTRKTMFVNSSITCGVCGMNFHVTCTNLSKYDYINMIVADKANWICSKCIDIFPFNNISDNRIFQKYAKNTWSIKIPLNCDDLLFDPFDSWSDSNPNILDDYDPDLNYYESSSVRQYSNSDYYDIDQFNDNMKDVAGLSMFHCNIRSATHNSSSLGDYLMSLKHEFDIVCLSETWLHENNKEINDFPNYSQVHKYRENKCGGGVSILIKSSIKFRQIDALALSTDVIECIFVELRMKTSNIIVGCVYTAHVLGSDTQLSLYPGGGGAYSENIKGVLGAGPTRKGGGGLRCGYNPKKGGNWNWFCKKSVSSSSSKYCA